MKKTIAITSALAAASSLATAEIKINEFLSFAGFVDASYSHTDLDVEGGKESDNSFGIDQVEIDWMFNFGKVTAQVDLQYENGANGDDDETEVEQAFVNYDLGNSLTITTGRYESTLGLEAKEPTGLYQYSTAYAAFGDDLNTLPQYAQGVKLTKEVDGNVYSLSIQDEAYDYDADRLGGSGDSGYGIEASASIALSDATTFFIGGAYGETDDDGDGYSINAHVTHVSGPWTFGAEVTYTETNDFGIKDIVADAGDELAALEALAGGTVTALDSFDLEVLQALVMANYAYSDCCSVTGRISYYNAEGSASGVVDGSPASASGDVIEFLKYTLAHNYAVTDNLAVITEISYVDAERLETVYSDELVGAVEVLFTF
jgi:hypothetical protein